jgi:AGCS family alanine or glycine:cation symporter
VLYTVLGVGVLFTIWSVFCQYRALTHGVAVTRGKYDDPDDPGAINHFQALSAALSATVGLGNIGGVAIAISLGGPGAVFWMWVVGAVGMALKTTEVTLAMLYRNTDDPDNPHGGAMWVAAKGFAGWSPSLAWVGKIVGALFCLTLLVSAVTGGNMFQSWNVADVTYNYFGINQLITGIVLAVLVGMVIIGGIKRIGAVAGRLVPFMCVLYFVSAVVVLVIKIDLVPSMFMLIVRSAFSPLEAQGAFLGGTFGYAFLWGMKRALFSNEAGQGSSPIAHSAAKTDEPVREAVVAGIEPFIDTIVVCTLTALVILTSGVWKRTPEAILQDRPAIIAVDGSPNEWTAADAPLPGDPEKWTENDPIYSAVTADPNPQTGNALHQLPGTIETTIDIVTLADGTALRGLVTAEDETGIELQYTDEAAGMRRTRRLAPADYTGAERGVAVAPYVHWGDIESTVQPSFDMGEEQVSSGAVYINYTGATLTARAFDAGIQDLGKWLVTLAAWLFAISTMISWSYYGEQGIHYLVGPRGVLPYKLIYCALIIVAAIPQLVSTDAELDALTSLGTGVMLWANIPIMLIFGYQAMRAYHEYMGRLKRGEMEQHAAPKFTDVVEGKDVE